MSQELIYTSVPRGLKPGSKGFCTVAMSAGMPTALIERLESLSGYRAVFPLGGARAADNPINWSHYRLQGTRSLLSRVAFAGVDYSQRSNKFAHHVVLDPREQPAPGPAWLLSQPGFMLADWKSEPQILSATRPVPAGPPPARSPRPCDAWASAAGDAGWAGVLAESFIESRTKPAYVIYAAGTDVLALFEEALSLLAPALRWQVTFSTYFASLPVGLECAWRGVPVESPLAKEVVRSAASRLLIDLTQPMTAPPPSPFVQAAREGGPPPATAAKAAAIPAVLPSEDLEFQVEEPEPELQLVSRSKPGLRRRLSKQPVAAEAEPPLPDDPFPSSMPVEVILRRSAANFILWAAVFFIAGAACSAGVFFAMWSTKPSAANAENLFARPSAPATKPAVASPVAMPIVTEPVPPTTGPAVASVPTSPDNPPVLPPMTRPAVASGPIIPETHAATPAPVDLPIPKMPAFSVTGHAPTVSIPGLASQCTTAGVVFPNNDTSIEFDVDVKGAGTKRESYLGTIGPSKSGLTVSRKYPIAVAMGYTTTNQTLAMSFAPKGTDMSLTDEGGVKDAAPDRIFDVLKLTRIDVSIGNQRYSLFWPVPADLIPLTLAPDPPPGNDPPSPPTLPRLVGGCEKYGVLKLPAANPPPGWSWKLEREDAGLLVSCQGSPGSQFDIVLSQTSPARITNTYGQTLQKLEDAEKLLQTKHDDLVKEIANLRGELKIATPKNTKKLNDQINMKQARLTEATADLDSSGNARKAFEGLQAQAFDISVVLKNGVQIAIIHVKGPN